MLLGALCWNNSSLNILMSLTQKYSLAFKIVENPSVKTMTSSFRTLSRSQVPPSTSRHTRQFHDLDYVVKSGFSTVKKVHSHKQLKPNKKAPNPQKKAPVFKIGASKVSQFTADKVIEADKYKIEELFKKNGVVADRFSPEALFSEPNQTQQKTAADRVFGLSGVEYKNTISGKISSRPSHHINFAKTSDRPPNINKIWYSRDKEYSPTDREPRDKNISHKIHYFQSDSPHKAFLPRESRDHFYDTAHSLKLVKQRTDKNVRQFPRMAKRSELEKKLGTQLQYEKDRSLQNRKRPLFEQLQSQRKLTFSKEVISPERGCYR